MFGRSPSIVGQSERSDLAMVSNPIQPMLQPEGLTAPCQLMPRAKQRQPGGQQECEREPRADAAMGVGAQEQAEEDAD